MATNVTSAPQSAQELKAAGAATIPAVDASGQTTAQLAEQSGISQGEVMEMQKKFPGLNPDAIIGNILMARQKAPKVEPAPTFSPITVTSDVAKEQDGKNMAELETVKTQYQPTSGGQATAFSDGSIAYSTAKGTPVYGKDGQVKGTVGSGLYGAEEGAKVEAPPKTASESLYASQTAQLDAEYADFVSQLDQRRATLDAMNQSAIDDIKGTFARRKAEMDQLNKGIIGAQTQAGIRAGRNKYAPEMEANIISETERAALDRMTELDRQERSAIAQAEFAAQQSDWELLDRQMSMYRDTNAQKRQAAQDLQKAVMDNERLLMDKMKEKREALEFEMKVEESLMKPIIEADKAAQDFMYDLALKYPDAGVLSSDTVEVATEKIRNSPAYKAELAYSLAQAAAKESGGTVSDATIRSFAQSLLQQGIASDAYEADELARSYYRDGYVPEAPDLGAGSQSVLEGAQRLASRNSEAQQGALMRSVNRKIENDDVIGATTDVYTNAYASLPATQQEKAFGYVQGLNDLDDIERLLSEYKAAGGDTGLLTGSIKAIKNKLKKADDPKLEEIGARVTLAMTNYRKAQSGAAFTESEERLYKEAFPSTLGSESYNAGKITALRDAFNVGLKSQLQTVLGSDVYESMETMRVAETKKPELEKKAVANGYDKEDISELIKEGFSWEEIDRAVSKKAGEGSVSTNAQAGSLSEKYESSGDPGAIGWDRQGGFSYGVAQLAHQNAKRFVEQSPYAEDFAGLAFNSEPWRNKWKEVAKHDPDGFANAQRQYVVETHDAPQYARLAKAGFDAGSFSPTLREVIHSTAVQHGGNTDVIEKALKKVDRNATDAEKIEAIYEERWSGGRRFASSTPQVQKAVKSRLDREKRDALSMLG